MEQCQLFHCFILRGISWHCFTLRGYRPELPLYGDKDPKAPTTNPVNPGHSGGKNGGGGGSGGGGGGGGKGSTKGGANKKQKTKGVESAKAMLRGFACCFGWNGKAGNRCINPTVAGQADCCQGRASKYIHACSHWFPELGRYCLSTEHGAGHVSHTPAG